MTERRIGDMVAVEHEGTVYVGIINAITAYNTYTVDVIADGVYRHFYERVSA